MIHGALGRENALDRAGGPEPTPRSLSLSSRRVGQRGAVVQPRVLAVFDARHPRLASRFVAFEWVGDDDPQHVTQALEAFNVEHRAILIHRSPAVIPSTVDAERDLVQRPLIAAPGRPAAQFVSEVLAEFQTPRAARLVGDVESPTADL